MFGGNGGKKGEDYVYDSFSCLKPRWRKAEQISHEEMVCAAAAMTTKRKGQMFSSEELPITSRNQITDATDAMFINYSRAKTFGWGRAAGLQCPWEAKAVSL